MFRQVRAEEQKDKQEAEQEQKEEAKQREENKADKVICFNYAGTGHYSTECPKEKVCHICRSDMHEVAGCPEWVKPREVAEYYGSANSGLGFC